MIDNADMPPSDEQNDNFRKLLVKIAWWQAVLFGLTALGATWIRGIGPNIILGWILVIFLCALSLFCAYGIRKTFLGIGALCVAAVLLIASIFPDKFWAVEAGQLQTWAIGSVACAIWFFAWDLKQHRIYPSIARAAGLIGFSGFVIYAVSISICGPTVAYGRKGLLGLAILAALYSLAEGPGKKVMSLGALVALVALLLEILPGKAF